MYLVAKQLICWKSVWVGKWKLEDGGGNGSSGEKICKLKAKDDSGGGGGKKGDGGVGVGEEVLLFLFFNLFNLFQMAKSTLAGPDACFTRSPAVTIIGFSASKVDISSKTSSSGFCFLKIFFFLGSSFCLKLTLVIL